MSNDSAHCLQGIRLGDNETAMRFFITSDANSESGLGETLYGINKAFDDYFFDRFYDDSGIEMSVIFMCRDPRWNFKQRIRFSKKENRLYMDIMLDLNVMSSADLPTRKQIVGEKLVNEVPQIVAKYKFKDFDLKRFSSDLRSWFEEHGWIDKESWPSEIK